MSSYKLISRWALALNAAVNWRARLASETLHCADFVHNPPIITAMTRNPAIDENHGTCPKSRYSWWLRIRDFLASLRMKYNVTKMYCKAILSVFCSCHICCAILIRCLYFMGSWVLSNLFCTVWRDVAYVYADQYTNTYTGSRKKVLHYCPYFCQMFTNYSNSFTVILSSKKIIKW